MNAFLAALGTAFILIVPVELPDKTFLATLVLTTKYRPWPVWIGASLAFLLQCVVAVAFGRLITLLPHALVKWVVVALFVTGAVILFRSARQEGEESDLDAAPAPTGSGLRAVGASFLVLFAAEWGDLSQLLTAGLVARGDNPFATFIGSWVGLMLISGVAVMLGRWLVKKVRLQLVRYVAAGICTALAVFTAIAA